MIRVTRHGKVLHIETDVGGVSIHEDVLRSGNPSFETRILCYLADYLEKQPRGGDEYLAYLEAAVKDYGFEVRHDGGNLAESNFRIVPTWAGQGIAEHALAGEIVEAVLFDENNGGCDLSAGMFGEKMTSLIRKIVAVYLHNQRAGS